MIFRNFSLQNFEHNNYLSTIQTQPIETLIVFHFVSKRNWITNSYTKQKHYYIDNDLVCRIYLDIFVYIDIIKYMPHISDIKSKVP